MIRSHLQIAAMLFGALLPACGVAFSDPARGNEFFTSLEVTGERRPLSEMTAAIAYEQYYPVDVYMTCDLVQNKKVLRQIGAETVRAHPSGGPEATPFPGNFSFDFSVEAPGEYKIECLTPKDEDNIITRKFSVRGEAVPTATPPLPIAQ